MKKCSVVGSGSRVNQTVSGSALRLKIENDFAGQRQISDQPKRTIASAGSELSKAARDLQGTVTSARMGAEQNRWLIGAALGGTVFGMILWAVFAGIVARAVPEDWQWPERMAARTLAMPIWEGGQRMMQTASPQAFADIVAGDRIVTANRQVLEACRKRADRARAAVSCTIKIGTGKQIQ